METEGREGETQEQEMKDVSEDRMRAKTKQERRGRQRELGKEWKRTARELEREQKRLPYEKQAPRSEWGKKSNYPVALASVEAG